MSPGLGLLPGGRVELGMRSNMSWAAGRGERMPEGCLACDLSAGRVALPGGIIFATSYWVIEHCVGPLGIGALVLKPRRHCLALSGLTEAEASELGPALHRVDTGAACQPVLVV